jgi:hypothetical protein
MKVERWDPEKHADLIAGWIRARGLGDPLDAFAMLPPTGFVVADTAAGWLYRTDAAQCFLTGIIADPAATKAPRASAIDAVLELLRAEARDLGYTAIAGAPSIPSLISRFEAHGYRLQHGCAFAIRRT